MGLVGCGAWNGVVLTASEPGDWTFQPDLPIVPAPTDPALWPAFRDQLSAWRRARRQSLSYDDLLYGSPEFEWVRRCFACGFLMVNDERFLDPGAGRFTPERVLEEAEVEFGGFDAVVLWQAYPRIGFDARNQFDFYRDLPGGLPGVRALSRALHARGVRVFVDWNPWDADTRPEGKPHVDALADLCAAIDADGIFLDTLPKGGGEFRPRLDAARRGVVLESELALAVEEISTHHMSWAQWFDDSAPPGVLRNKWFERRHLQHQIRRWNADHTGELHTAWMNGSGMMIWENVFGSWNGWCARDRSMLRAILPVQRRFAATFAGEHWTPLVATSQPGVYASLWESEGVRLWTLVNRSERAVDGELLPVEAAPSEQCFDLIAGREVSRPAGRLEARGIGGYAIARPGTLSSNFDGFLRRQAENSRRFDPGKEVHPLVVKPRSTSSVRAMSAHQAGMVEIPAADFVLRTEFRLRECGCYTSNVIPSIREELHRAAIFERPVRVRRMAFDETPVTNAEYGRFLKESGWRPTRPENFLKHWPAGKSLLLPLGKEDHPVVYVDLDDARAYAAWAGKRLPTEEEWQHAAQGRERLTWPWGPEWRDGLCNGGRPLFDSVSGAAIGLDGETTPVRAFPDGRSPFGVFDLCGNVWEWTESEKSDGRTRFALLKGGSYYSRTRSAWYADGGPKPNAFVAKYLLAWPGIDRSATVGFRCAADQV